jgi:hypothetical protein
MSIPACEKSVTLMVGSDLVDIALDVTSEKSIVKSGTCQVLQVYEGQNLLQVGGALVHRSPPAKN